MIYIMKDWIKTNLPWTDLSDLVFRCNLLLWSKYTLPLHMGLGIQSILSAWSGLEGQKRPGTCWGPSCPECSTSPGSSFWGLRSKPLYIQTRRNLKIWTTQYTPLFRDVFVFLRIMFMCLFVEISCAYSCIVYKTVKRLTLSLSVLPKVFTLSHYCGLV